MFLSIRTVIITKQNNQKLPHLTKMRKHIIFSLILSLSCLTGYAKTIQTPKDDGELEPLSLTELIAPSLTASLQLQKHAKELY